MTSPLQATANEAIERGAARRNDLETRQEAGPAGQSIEGVMVLILPDRESRGDAETFGTRSILLRLPGACSAGPPVRRHGAFGQEYRRFGPSREAQALLCSAPSLRGTDTSLKASISGTRADAPS